MNRDDIIHRMGDTLLININNGQPIMWICDSNGNECLHHVDALRMNEDSNHDIEMCHQFHINKKATDHFPNHVLFLPSNHIATQNNYMKYVVTM